MPETEPRTPDPQGQDRPRVTASAIPADEPADPPAGAPAPASASASASQDDSAGAQRADRTETDRIQAARTEAARTEAARPDRAGAEGAERDRAAGPAHAGPAHAGPTSRRARKAKAREGRSPLFLWLKEVATVVIVAIVLSFLIKTFLFRAFYIPSESMVNTLDVNDRIFVNLLVPEPMALQRGDVVVFRDSQGWLAPAAEKTKGPFTWVQDGLTFVGLLPDNSEQHLVKRVIGLPGDHVVCCDAGGQLTVNGVPLDEKYINSAEIPQVRDFDVVVPAGKVWVMGDNRNHSADSRAHMDTNGGFVNESDIEGKAAVIAWPLNRMSALDNYPDVFRSVPAPAGK
ncbi:signal peptidase I [Arthrobacter sp. 9MFCol3.1]|uniref:signal peptidase I n=1 Tax=Arthrobacter sp. 9MFCol3.1 TaxID=1150398 RepID=UPI00047D4C4B|nr:signal peptidase I [Arthrobacter sp. 9MFCol3.1]